MSIDVSSPLILSPHGRLYAEVGYAGIEDGTQRAFAEGSAHGLLALVASRTVATGLPTELAFWREFAQAFLSELARAPESADGHMPAELPMPPELGTDFTLRIPAMRGAEYASPELFATLWSELKQAAQRESKRAGGLRKWLSEVNPALHLLGKVTFHLAENKRTPDTPFAFMATYTHRLSAQEKPVHLPLARALQEYAGAKNQAALRSLLEPVQLAAERSEWAREMLDSRAVFQPLAWDTAEAYAFLREVPVLESSGIITRIPNWWKNGRGPRPQVSVRIGDKKGTGVGMDSMLKFSIETTLGGDKLTPAEWKTLMAAQSGLVSLRGQWVEVDRTKLATVLDHWKRVSDGALGEGVSFLEGMRLLSGVTLDAGTTEAENVETAEWGQIVAGDWLRDTLEQMRAPGSAAMFDPNQDLNAALRPYQADGVKWLWFLQKLGLGACLADDMGLGKTIQVIALLLQLKREANATVQAPALLVAPASLLANWKNELRRFAPSLRVSFLHPSESDANEWRDEKTGKAFVAGADIVLTTYGQAIRLDWLTAQDWRLLILDEAQAIKNPSTKQTRAIKKLHARGRIALSGTPVENRLGDLWSLYDFLNPGLLGAGSEFSRYVKKLQDAEPPNFAPLRQLVRPYLLRRLKTDRSIISDLPDKTELAAWCNLSKRQAAIYQQNVNELAEQLNSVSEGIQRRGLVLAYLMRFKQICNHPSHWTGDGAFEPADSGKFARLTELCEEISSRGEKALIFTQFKEMTEPLAAHLRGVFGRPGLVLHGSVAIKERQKLVADFQRDDGPPFFVLSLKAGGTGLTLTAASHVIHFDRWWNPAVENQATDRAFRIGQKRNVLVHKFVCRGTIEERIDALINDKRSLAESVLGAEGGAETLLTEMSNAELLQFVALDLNSARGE
jgi:superfamily II DNA or RNA helicase